MEKIPEIQIWHENPKPVFHLDKENKTMITHTNFRINILEDKVSLPEDLEVRVSESWDSACEKKSLKDNPVLYLDSIEGDQINSREGGFRYTYAFNRDMDFYNDVSSLNKYRLLTLSTHSHILTKDGRLLFGTKRDQFNHISGFGGFPNFDTDLDARGRILEIHRSLSNRLVPEIGELVDSIVSIEALGITYVNRPGLRGTDVDFLIRLDEPSWKVKEKFESNAQFKNELYVVDFDPVEIRKFIWSVFDSGKEMSPYALGCEYLVNESEFGEGDKYIKSLNRMGINIAKGNFMKYFNS
jgi:hypothetical protein